MGKIDDAGRAKIGIGRSGIFKIDQATAGCIVANRVGGCLRIIGPELGARCRVKGTDLVEGRAQVEPVADLDRSVLIAEGFIVFRQVAGAEFPEFFQFTHIAGGDLAERGIAARALGAAIGWPVHAGLQCRVGNCLSRRGRRCNRRICSRWLSGFHCGGCGRRGIIGWWGGFLRDHGLFAQARQGQHRPADHDDCGSDGAKGAT